MTQDDGMRGRRIVSWKRIASFFARGERTVRRWEQEENLPVHRHQHGGAGSVYAFERELNDWLQSRTAKKPVDNAQAANGPARDHYLKGLEQLNQLKVSALNKAVQDFDKAIDCEPGFASAYARKAETLQLLTVFGAAAPVEAMPEALETLAIALSYAPASAEANAALGLILTCYSYEWAGAERAFDTAVRENADYAPAHQWRAELLAVLGRFDEADEAIERARKIDPASLSISGSKGYVLCLSRRFEALIGEMAELCERDRHFPLAYINLGLGYSHANRHQRAVETFTAGVKNTSGYPDMIALKAYALGKAGRIDEARAERDLYRRRIGNRPNGAFMNGIAALGMGDPDDALECFEKAYEARVWQLNMLGQDALFDPLRLNPRFRALLEKMNLASSSVGVS